MQIKNGLKVLSGICVLVMGILLQNTSHAYYIDHAGSFDFSTTTPGHELGCLALNIYHEGRGESLKGQSAIAAVTLNRVRSKHFPDTVCEVVWQRKQFSWTNIAARHHSITNINAWSQALVIARLFVDGARVAQVGKATHYHADTVKPYWVAENKLVGKVGNHYFYIL
jgi:N-acetylmuramoyl-L-alanine amidase